MQIAPEGTVYQHVLYYSAAYGLATVIVFVFRQTRR